MRVPVTFRVRRLRSGVTDKGVVLNLKKINKQLNHSKSGALLVGDPCLKKITDKRGNPIYDPLKYARMEVEMIGEILKSQTLTGEDATKEAVLQRIASVALVHSAAHRRKETVKFIL